MDQRGLHRNAWIGLPETGRSAHRVPFPARRQKEGGGCVISQGIERMRMLSIDDVLLGCERRTTASASRRRQRRDGGRNVWAAGAARGVRWAREGSISGARWDELGGGWNHVSCCYLCDGYSRTRLRARAGGRWRLVAGRTDLTCAMRKGGGAEERVPVPRLGRHGKRAPRSGTRSLGRWRGGRFCSKREVRAGTQRAWLNLREASTAFAGAPTCAGRPRELGRRQ